MIQTKSLILSGVVTLALLSLQVSAGHESQQVHGMWGSNHYGAPPAGAPGHSGTSYNQGSGHVYSNQHNRGYGHHANQHGSMMGHGAMDRLKLNDEQRSAIRKIMRNSKSDFRNIYRQLADKRYALYDLLDEGKAGKASDKLADAMGDLMAERIKLRTRLRININELLDKNQREKARDMMFFGQGFSG